MEARGTASTNRSRQLRENAECERKGHERIDRSWLSGQCDENETSPRARFLLSAEAGRNWPEGPSFSE